MIEKIIGKFPEKMLKAATRRRSCFGKDGRFLIDELHPTEIEHVDKTKTLHVDFFTIGCFDELGNIVNRFSLIL